MYLQESASKIPKIQLFLRFLPGDTVWKAGNEITNTANKLYNMKKKCFENCYMTLSLFYCQFLFFFLLVR